MASLTLIHTLIDRAYSRFAITWTGSLKTENGPAQPVGQFLSRPSPQQEIDDETDCEINEEARVDSIKMMLCVFGQPRLDCEVDEIAEQDCQQHPHPVVDHCQDRSS